MNVHDDEILKLDEAINLVNDLKHEYPNATDFELIIRAFQRGYNKACDDIQYIEA